MYREIPSANKILSRKWNDYEQQVHLKKLRDARAQITLQPPNRFRHFQVKAKKDQMQEERFTEIERANRILLQKMTIIMNKEKHVGPNRSTSHVSQVATILPPAKRSLNVSVRKKETERIRLENKAFLRRLQDRTSTYNVNKWEEEEKEREHRLHNLCQFKYILRDQNRHSFASNLRNRGLSRDQSIEMRLRGVSNQERDERGGVSQSLDVEHLLPPVDRARYPQNFMRTSEIKDPNQTVMTDLPPESIRPPPLLNQSIDNPLQPRIAQTQGQDHGQSGNSLFTPKGAGEFLPPPQLGTTSILDDRPKGSVSPHRVQHPQAFDFLKRKKYGGEKLKPLNLKSLQIFEGPALKRIVLFREEFQINHKNFLIEISRTKKKMMILALDIDLMTTSKQLLIELTERQAKKLMDECGNDYRNVVKRLHLKYDRLLQIKEINPPLHTLPLQFHPSKEQEYEIDGLDQFKANPLKQSRPKIPEYSDMDMPEQIESRQFQPPRFPNVSHATGETQSIVAVARRSPSPVSRALSPDRDQSEVNYGGQTPVPNDERPRIQEQQEPKQGNRVIPQGDPDDEQEYKATEPQESDDQKTPSGEQQEGAMAEEERQDAAEEMAEEKET